MNRRALVCAALLFAMPLSLAFAQTTDRIVIIQPVKHDTSPRLSDLVPGPVSPGRHVVPLYRPGNGGGGGGGGSFTDPVLQSTATATSTLSTFTPFAGLGTDSDSYAPPDTNGAAGTKQYVQSVNVSLGVFDKASGSPVSWNSPSGSTVSGAVPINTLWSGFGGSCQNNNGGDPIVLFDKLNSRWVVMQIQYSGFGGGGGNYLCIAVSNGDDWTTNFTWQRYAYSFSNLTDYPKMGIWTDAYYVTFNAFKGFGTFAGPVVCAFDLAQAGATGKGVCKGLSTSFASLLPADIDSTSQLPASGEPEYLVSMGNPLWTWRFHVDIAALRQGSTGTTTLSSAQAATVNSTKFPNGLGFQQACGGGTCIPQYNTTQQLDSLGDRLMYRLAYRNFTGAGYEALVVNHSVTAASTGTTGIRWYELRNTPSTSYLSPVAPAVYQAGTYSPDSNYRWMGSAAMDAKGNIAVGYSLSSSNLHPSIYIAERCAADTLGQLRTEAEMQAGRGSQNGSLSRWGDYASMSVDPNGSLWFTTEYLQTDGSFNWHTAIGNFTLSGCP